MNKNIAMNNDLIKNKLDDFLEEKKVKSDKCTENEVCDPQTGECYTIKTKDGLVERINKKYVIEDGRQLIID